MRNLLSWKTVAVVAFLAFVLLWQETCSLGPRLSLQSEREGYQTARIQVNDLRLQLLSFFGDNSPIGSTELAQKLDEFEYDLVEEPDRVTVVPIALPTMTAMVLPAALPTQPQPQADQVLVGAVEIRSRTSGQTYFLRMKWLDAEEAVSPLEQTVIFAEGTHKNIDGRAVFIGATFHGSISEQGTSYPKWVRSHLEKRQRSSTTTLDDSLDLLHTSSHSPESDRSTSGPYTEKTPTSDGM